MIVTLPISGPTSEKTVKHALSGEFVNLSDFLPNLTEPVANLETYSDTEGTMQFRAKRPTRGCRRGAISKRYWGSFHKGVEVISS